MTTTRNMPEASEEITALMALADIRSALGVGDKPMLSELAGIVGDLVKALTAALDDRDVFVEREKAANARVAGMVEALDRFSRLGNGDLPGIGIAADMLAQG